MKKAILIIIVLAVLAVAGIGGLAMVGRGPFPNLIKTVSMPAAPKIVAPPEKVFDLGTYIIPIVAKKTISRQIGMDMDMVVDAAAAPKISEELPRLQNAILLDLYDFMPHHADAHSATDKEAIRQHLVKIANGMFGEGVVHDIVIKSIYDR